MIKRIFLFIFTNIAIILMASIFIFFIEKIFGINISGYAPGGSYISLFIFALVFGFGGAFISLFISKWMAKKAYKIQIIDKENVLNLSEKEKVVWDVVSELSERNHINMPEVGIYESSEPNAFATGASKNNSLVAVSTGLLDNMTKDEIEGVIGHEMAHILNGDMVTMTLLQGVLNTFVIFFARILAGIVEGFLKGNNDEEESNGHSFIYTILSLIFELIFGFLAGIIAMWFSRYREYRADAGSAKFVGKEKMIMALQALKKMEPVLINSQDGKDKLAAFKIDSKKSKGLLATLFSSHPDLDDRIKALESLRNI